MADRDGDARAGGAHTDYAAGTPRLNPQPSDDAGQTDAGAAARPKGQHGPTDALTTTPMAHKVA